MKSIIVILITVALASCVASDKPNFTKMTQVELGAYNATVAAEDRVYCAEVQPHPAIRRTKYLCVTAKEIEQGVKDAADRRLVRDTAFTRYNGPLIK